MKAALRTAVAAALSAAAVAPALPAQAPQFTLDRAHTQVMFRVRHLGVSYVTGRFKEFTGGFVFDSVNPGNSSAQITIQTASVDTENERRDNDLRSSNFFAADSFPTITFQSTRIERGSAPGTWRMTGNLTMRGVTREITLDVELTGMQTVSGQQGRQLLAGFLVTGRLNRFDYGLQWNRMVESLPVVSDEVRLTIEAEARAPLPAN